MTLQNLVNSLAEKLTENTTWKSVAVIHPTTEILENLPIINKMGNNYVSIYLSSFVKNKPASITNDKPLCITSLRPKKTRNIIRGCTVTLSNGSTQALNLIVGTDGTIAFNGNV